MPLKTRGFERPFPNLLLLNRGTMTSLSLFKPLSSNFASTKASKGTKGALAAMDSAQKEAASQARGATAVIGNVRKDVQSQAKGTIAAIDSVQREAVGPLGLRETQGRKKQHIKTGSLQCGFWPRNSPTLFFLILPWNFGWIFPPVFFPRKEARKIHQKIPRKIHPGLCSENSPRISAEAFS